MVGDTEAGSVEPTAEEAELQKLQAVRYVRLDALRQAGQDEQGVKSPEAIVARARAYADFVLKG